MQHQMRLNSLPFEYIKQGKQQIETRLYDEKRRRLHIGDTITFSKLPKETDKLTVKIIGLSIFSSFQELFQSFDKSMFGFKDDTAPDYQLECIRKYYSLEDEQKFGVIGIHILPLE